MMHLCGCDPVMCILSVVHILFGRNATHTFKFKKYKIPIQNAKHWLQNAACFLAETAEKRRLHAQENFR